MSVASPQVAIPLAILSMGIVLLSLYGVLLPRRLLGLVSDVMSGEVGLWSAVAVRLLFAALLWLAAPVSRTPVLFDVLAAVLILSAIAHLIAGRARLGRFRESLASWPSWAIRLPCLLGVAMGGLLLWSISSAIRIP